MAQKLQGEALSIEDITHILDVSIYKRLTPLDDYHAPIMLALRSSSDLQQCHALKKALLKLARAVAPQLSALIEDIGRLYTRSPSFFVVCGFIGDEATNPAIFSRMKGLRQIDSGKIATVDHDLVGVCENLFARVSLDLDGEAAIELLSILASVHPSDELVLHFSRKIDTNIEEVIRRDRKRMAATGRKCAMTANWPRPGQSFPNVRSYSCFMRECLEGNIRREDFMHVSLHLHTAFQDDRGNLPLSKTRLKAPELVPELLNELRLYEERFSKATARGDLWHVTPPVAEALLRLTGRAIRDLWETEEIVLDRENHLLFERVNAARVISDIAAKGNDLAVHFLTSSMLHDPHWAIRQVCVKDAVHIMATMPIDHPEFHRTLTAIMVFAFNVDGQPGMHSVQSEAQEAILARVPGFDTRARDIVVFACKQYCSQDENKKNKDFLQNLQRNIVSADEDLRIRNHTARTGRPDLRKERRRQAERELRASRIMSL